MKTIKNFKQLFLATALLFCAAFSSSISAQGTAKRSDILPNGEILSAAQMNALHPTDFNKTAIIFYLKTHLGVSVGSEKPTKDDKSMEARIALTLVKVLTEPQRMQYQDNMKGAGGDKNKTQQPQQENLTSCGSLNYPGMWEYLGLCK